MTRAPVAVASVHGASPHFDVRVKETVARAGVALGVGDSEEERGDELPHIVATRRELHFKRGAPPSLRVGLVEEEPGDRAVLEGFLVTVVVGLVELFEEPVHCGLVESVHERDLASARKRIDLAGICDGPAVDDHLVPVWTQVEHVLRDFVSGHAGDFVLDPDGLLAARVEGKLDVAALELLRNGEHGPHPLARQPVVVIDEHLEAAFAAFVEDDVHVAPPAVEHPALVRTRLDRERPLSALGHHAHVVAQTLLALRAVHPEERPGVLPRRAPRQDEILAHPPKRNLRRHRDDHHGQCRGPAKHGRAPHLAFSIAGRKNFASPLRG